MPTDYLIDTNTLTDLANAHPTALANLHDLDPDDGIFTCFVVIGEWEYGILHAPGETRRQAIRAAGQAILAAVEEIWESSPAVAREYAAILAHLRAAGSMIPTNDVWIAAVAKAHGATIATSDPHLARVPDLPIVDWTRPS